MFELHGTKKYESFRGILRGAPRVKVIWLLFVPPYPDPSKYADEVEIHAKDVNGSVMTDVLGNVVTQTVLVVRDQAKEQQLMDAHKRE